MIPRVDLIVDIDLPSEASYWVPSDASESLGYFHNVRSINNVGSDDARSTVETEQSLVALADRLAVDAEGFDRVAGAIEFYNPDFDYVEPELEGYGEELWDCYAGGGGLEGLDLGVAGLVMALAAVGVLPAASCRGHTGPTAWSPHPVVFFAADRAHAEWLRGVVAGSGCGFSRDDERPDLLSIVAPSVVECIGLASSILRAADSDWPAGLSRTVDLHGSDGRDRGDDGWDEDV